MQSYFEVLSRPELWGKAVLNSLPLSNGTTKLHLTLFQRFFHLEVIVLATKLN